jgi:hypothetical protein
MSEKDLDAPNAPSYPDRRLPGPVLEARGLKTGKRDLFSPHPSGSGAVFFVLLTGDGYFHQER